MEQLQYERKLEDLEKARAADVARIAALERDKQLARYERDLFELANQGFAFTVDEELAEVSDLTPEQFEKHKVRIVAKYARDPSRVPDVQVLNGEVGRKRDPDDITDKQQDVALTYMRKHGCEFDEALEKTNGQAVGARR